MESIGYCNSFLSFKERTYAYLLKISITHNKNLIPLLYLIINYISAKSVPQILSYKDEYDLRFSNFLIIDLYNWLLIAGS